MRRKADAVVVGGGLLGTFIGLELARKKIDTLVIDSNTEVGRESTRSSTGVVSSFHGTKPAIALAYEGRQTFEDWREHLDLPRSRAKYQKVGCALVHKVTDSVGDALERLLRSVGVTVESLAGREAQGLVPGMRTTRTRVLFECGAGYISSPSLAARDVRTAAETAGTRFLFDERVVEIESTNDPRSGGRKVTGLTTSAGTKIDTPVIINAAGVRSAAVNLLARAPLPLTTVAYARCLVKGDCDTKPDMPVVADLTAGHYVRFDAKGFRLGPLRTPGNGTLYLKAPDDRLSIAKTLIPERRKAFLKRHPGIRWRDVHARLVTHDMTVLDSHPIVDRTDVAGFYVAIGNSDGWFASEPSLAWLMSELVATVEGGRDHDAKPLRVTLPKSGIAFDLGFLSRHRSAIKPTVEIPTFD